MVVCEKYPVVIHAKNHVIAYVFSPKAILNKTKNNAPTRGSNAEGHIHAHTISFTHYIHTTKLFQNQSSHFLFRH